MLRTWHIVSQIPGTKNLGVGGMSDIVERLRKNGTDQYDPCGLCDEAADEIERLREETACMEQTLLLNRKHITKLENVLSMLAWRHWREKGNE